MKINRSRLLSDYGIDLPIGKYRIIEIDGNYKISTVKDDTEGCVLLGMRATDHTLIGGTSRPAVQLVKNEVRGALARGERVTIEISNPVMKA